MRKAMMFGAVILLAGSVGVAVAQERLPQHSGFGTGVGENAGTGTRQGWKVRVAASAAMSAGASCCRSASACSAGPSSTSLISRTMRPR